MNSMPADYPAPAIPSAVPSVPTPAQAAPQAFAPPSGGATPVVQAPAPVQVPAPATSPSPSPAPSDDTSWSPWGTGIVAASAALSAYHGFKRNDDSAGWGLTWGLLGALFPIITPLVALAEGFAVPSDDVRLGRIEDALERRPDLAAAMHAQMTR
jgi:hypothetical protein